MKEGGHAFPPILPRDELPNDVLVLVAHPDDEVIGIGGLLAFHGARGDRVDVVHATSGDDGDPDSRHEDIADLRRREVTRALAELAIPAPSGLGFPDGDLESAADALTDRVRALFAERKPRLLYTFHAGEFHADHRALARAACSARDALEPDCRMLLFGVNQTVPFGSLYDYSDLVAKKQSALACFESQLAYLDFATKVMHRDQAATVNVEIPEVTHAELIREVTRDGWPLHLERTDALIVP